MDPVVTSPPAPPAGSAEPAASLWETLIAAASASSELHCIDGDELRSASYAQVVQEAELMTGGMRRAGIGPGARAAAILTNGPSVPRGILATWMAGGALASLPVPARGMDGAEYERQLRAICQQLEPEVLLIEERLAGVVPEGLREQSDVRTWESFAGSGRVEASPPGDDELAFIQYSSGSTAQPKGCMLTSRAIAEQTQIVVDMIDGRPGEDVGSCWLPLSHDMGVFGFLISAWANDISLYLSPPERFIFTPRTWFEDAARFGVTITGATNSALFLGARAHVRSPLPGELALRVLIIGAERVQAETLDFALQTLSPYGLRAEAFMPAYGLAEATLAVSGTPSGEAPRSLVLDALALADGELAACAPAEPHATTIVSAGPPCRGVSLPGLSGERLQEIRVASPALSSGYYADPDHTAARFRDGALSTGDLGFSSGGELYPVGRLDDLISVGGRNVYAREVESAIEGLPGIRRGCSTIVEAGDRSGSRLTLCVELSGAEADFGALAERSAGVAMAKAAVPLHECVFLERDTLPKTPSGKIQRHRARHLLESGELRPLRRVRVGGP